MNILDLFSGIGGFSLGLERAGMRTIAFCEIDPYCRKILRKHWPNVPIFNDVRELHVEDIQEPVDVVCGGFPCQDISAAGLQRGIHGERSGLYREMLRIIGECRPQFAVFENVTNFIAGNGGKWFAEFLYDLATIRYDAEWHCIPASAIGAAHHRDRIWIVAYPNGSVQKGSIFSESLFINTKESRSRQFARAINACLPADDYARMRPHLNDVPEQMAQLMALGNAVVPQIPELIGWAIINATRPSEGD